MVTLKNLIQLFSGARILFPFSNLGTYLHQRIQKSHALRHQHNLISPKLLFALLGQLLSLIENPSAKTGIVGQNSQDSMSQKAFPGTAGAYSRYDFPFMNRHVQISNHV